MDKEQFLARLDKDLANSKEAQAEVERRGDLLHQQADQFVKLATPVLAEYKAALANRGLDVETSVGERYFHFQLNYRGGYIGFEFTHCKHGSGYEYLNLFTDKGRHYTSVGGPALDPSEWTSEHLEKKIQEMVEKYMLSHHARD
jgi:hypothetical protein